MHFKQFCLLLLLFTATLQGSMHPEQGIMGFYERKFESPEPFEKIYVRKDALVFMPDGAYLKHHCGVLEKIFSFSEDYKGTYILRVHTQCPECGKVYKGRAVPEGWNCLKEI